MIETISLDEKGMPLRPGVNGGLYRKEKPELKPVNYISVEAIEKYMEKVKTLGGKILGPRQEVPNVSWIAYAFDPEGNPFPMLEPLR